ncbi:MAG: L-threonylcarbamoyladenylate synthase [Candidatus ainarchaeum sp.]|nr:L-threonylcarbamoyladenylate synthase [Candidatus ainarchaeum sp.]
MAVTKIIRKDNLGVAIDALNNHDVVAFPTETVYGLGAKAFDKKAVKKIFKIKGRKFDNPLIVHISNLEQINLIAKDVPPIAYDIGKKFWPGPLSIVLKKSDLVSDLVTANLDTVAIRMPNNKIALKLINAVGPVAAPSANLSGKPSCVELNHILDDLTGKINYVIDGGKSKIGLESTVIDLTSNPFVLLRPGKISFEELEKFFGKGKIIKYKFENSKITIASSPGMKYKHYSPNAKVKLVKNIASFLKNNKLKNFVLISSKKYDLEKSNINFVFKSNEHLAKNIFSWFRKSDKLKKDYVFVEEINEKHLGNAILNRVKKACEKN